MLVVSITGSLSNAVLPALETCKEEIIHKFKATRIVLFFQQVDFMSADVISLLAQIQRDIRLKPAELRVCGLRDNLKERLLKMGILRGMELASDLRAALLSFEHL